MSNNISQPVDRNLPGAGSTGRDNLFYGLVEFIHILRHLGVRVSVAEARDAIDAFSRVDLLARGQVKTALRAMLVKNHYDRKVFDLAFDAFFTAPEIRRERLEQRKERKTADKGSGPEQCDELVRVIKEDERDWGRELLNLLYLTVEENEKKSIRPGPAKKQYLETIDRLKSGRNSGPRPAAVEKTESSLTRWRREMLKQAMKSGAVSPGNVSTGMEERDDVIETVAAGLGARSGEESLLYEDMKNIAERDLVRATLLIKKLSRRLATRISRRYFRKNRRGRLDIRRTIRKNFSYGGALMELKYQSRKEQKPRLVLICDVSGSMARYAVFVIQFIYGLSKVVRGIETFIFSEDLERITPNLKKADNFLRTMSTLMEKSVQWGLGTNLHASLVAFLEEHRRLLAPSVFVIIISDAHTIQAYQAAGALQEIRGKVRDIIWLNTMPRKTWDHSPETLEFGKHCRMFECSTLNQLNKVLSNQMLSGLER